MRSKWGERVILNFHYFELVGLYKARAELRFPYDKKIVPKRILFIHNANICGGAENSLIDLFFGFYDSNHKEMKVFLGLPRPGYIEENDFARFIRFIYLPILRIQRKKSPIYLFKLILAIAISNFKIYWIIKKKRIQLLHSNNSQSLLFCLFAGKITKQ